MRSTVLILDEPELHFMCVYGSPSRSSICSTKSSITVDIIRDGFTFVESNEERVARFRKLCAVSFELHILIFV